MSFSGEKAPKVTCIIVWACKRHRTAAPSQLPVSRGIEHSGENGLLTSRFFQFGVKHNLIGYWGTVLLPLKIMGVFFIMLEEEHACYLWWSSTPMLQWHRGPAEKGVENHGLQYSLKVPVEVLFQSNTLAFSMRCLNVEWQFCDRCISHTCTA